MMPHSTPQPRHVFVYGTLRAGGSNDITRFLPRPVHVGNTTMAGTLYSLGAYPGAVLGGEGVLHGEVYRIAPEVEGALDRLEGVTDDDCGEYIKRHRVLAVDGLAVDCLVYEIQSVLVERCAVIASGDWFRRDFHAGKADSA